MNNKKIKIALFTDTICDANGVSRFLQDMAKESLKQEDIQLDILSSTVKTYCDKVENIHIFKPSLKIKMPFYKELDLVIPPLFQMSKMIKELDPDIIHISTPGFVGLTGRMIAAKYKKPVVGTYHTDFPAYMHKNTNSKMIKTVTAFYMKIFYKKFKALATRSKKYIQNIKDDVKFDNKEIFVLRAGTNIKTFDPKYKDRDIWENYGIDKEYKKFIYVGRVSKEKNVDKLFETWKEFYDISEQKKSHLVIVGSGDLEKHKSELESYNVVFLGHKSKEELSTLYASSDMFIFPSTTDTLGQVILESMASATPVLVTDEGGPYEIVHSSKKSVGFIHNINEEAKWINILTNIENEIIDTNELGKTAYTYSQNFSITNTFESFADFHIKILNNFMNKNS